MNSEELLQHLLRAASGNTTALRAITRLQPAEGKGGKVFPPSYADSAYAFEKRMRDGRQIDTVLLDSVQSQSNRFEEVLSAAWRENRLSIPVFEVEIPGHERITTLNAPHRVHDAIFRDSLWDGEPFRDSEFGKRIAASRAWDATAFYEFAPTVLLFGSWDSQSGSGTHTAKIARCLVAEIVALDVVRGVRTSSRMDPLGIKNVPVVALTGNRDIWRYEDAAADSRKPPKSASKPTRPSEINHGNILPTITAADGPGGVTFEEAIQTVVLSFTQLRKLRFPGANARLSAAGDQTVHEQQARRDQAGRAAIAALGLYAIALQWEDGFQLRSRCQLIPVETPTLEWIGRTATDTEPLLELDAATARAAFEAAVAYAAEQGLAWKAGAIKLQPREDLVKLVQYSDRATEPTGQV